MDPRVVPRALCTLGIIALTTGSALFAQDPPTGVIAYQVPEGTVGNQEFGGALGLDFDVAVDVEVTHLGVFDSGQDGLARPITARLYDREFLEELGAIEFTTEDPGELIGGSRFKQLDDPIELPAGFQGTISAAGYGLGEPNGNVGNASVWTVDDGDCAILFVGGGRFGDAAAPETFPGTPDGGPPNRYASGSFIFDQLENSPPPDGGIPFVVPEFTFGNQDYGLPLGMDFSNSVPIRVTRLGVFDSGTDGLGRDIQASLWDRSTQTELARLTFTPDDPGDPEGGSTFKDLDEPIVLPAGFEGTIVAEGYGLEEMNGNNLPELTTDSDFCAISFLGGRFGDVPGGYPQTPDPGAPHRYGAGTFEYEISDTEPELPPAPTGLSALAGDAQVTLSWNAPAGGPAISGYLVFQTKPAFLRVTPAVIAETSLVVPGLTNGVEVCYLVRSIPADGGLASGPSNGVCATPSTPRVPDELFISFEVPASANGTQNFGGTLGLDFDVRREIAITRLGLLDSGSDGILPEEGTDSRTLVARLWDRATQTEIASLEFTTEDPGELVGGNRFKPLPAAIVLPAGFRGTISAEGYGPAELAGNTTVAPIPGLTKDNGLCSIAFVGSRFGGVASFPATQQFGGETRLWASGTFEFGPFDPGPEADGGIAYVVPEGTIGNQAFGGPLGMDFNVQSDILVTSLGVFDDGSDGLLSPISARLYNRDTQTVLAEINFDPLADEGDLDGGSRFLELDRPLGLPAGFHGTMVASGYGAGDQNGNQGAALIDGVTTDDGGCLIEFVGGGRFGDAGAPGAFPGTGDGGPPNRYLAGTFRFEPSDEPVFLPPETPRGLSVREVEPGSTSLLVSWLPSGGTTPPLRYEVLRADAADGAFVVIGSVDAPETEFVDAVGASRTLCYSVRAIAANDNTSDDAAPVCATAGASVPGRVIAYRVPSGTAGNDLTEDALGLDFDVLLDIQLTRLGVFDDGSNGLARPLTVFLYDRDTESIEAAVEFDSDDPGVLIGGSRFQEIGEDIELPAGFHGSIVVEGYGVDERAAIGAFNALDPGPCSISFAGSRRDLPGGFPFAQNANSNPYAAGTFEFEPIETLPPGERGIAYINPEGTVGNQAFSGSLGLDFDVVHESGIGITRLGVFDDGSDGLNLPLVAVLYRRDTQEELARLEFTPEDPGELIDGSRFKDLPQPIRLAQGFEGTIVGAGYGTGEQNGNQGAVDLGLLTDTAGCLIRFVGGGRFGDAALPGVFPTNVDGGPPNRYAAGTFEFVRGDLLPGGGGEFVRGDADASGSTNITDGVFVLNFLFQGGGDPPCKDAADADDSGGINITDGIYILNFLFLGGADPLPPFESCGTDPTDDDVSCDAFPPCTP